MRYLLFLTFFMVFSASQAKTAHDKDYLSSCSPLAIQKESALLSADKPIIIMIHNTSANNLWISHSPSLQNGSSSAGFSSAIDTGRWSALRLNEKAFEINCIESRPGHEQQVPCRGLISLCHWTKATVANKATTTVLLGENLDLRALKEHLLMP